MIERALIILVVAASTVHAEPTRAEREVAFHAEAIRFGDIAVVSTDGSEQVSVTTVAYRGERRISLAELYETVERPDLARRLERRRNFGLGSAVVGGVAVLGASILFATKGVTHGMSDDDEERDVRKWRTVSIGLAGGGLVLGIVGVYYLARANPLSDGEVHALADAYNAKLRVKHGLSSARLVPYAAADGGGLALTGQF
jgi:hypothetical protein